ncbi:MAG: hypothetical protein J0L51_07000 [Rhizobiales bacterium]|nr:hypothetical protein [Hyphomicrobiales bacterium]
MPAVAFHKVSSLPGAPAAHALYFVQDGSFADLFVTDSAGAAKGVGTAARINALADARIAAALAAHNAIEIVADITARNALVASLNRNAVVLVTDATGDATVAAGAALYAFNDGASSWTKLTEFESMDLTLAWTSISGRPSSSPAQIEGAVTDRHTHGNKAVLDKFSESGGAPYYNGSPIGGGGSLDWATAAW